MRKLLYTSTKLLSRNFGNSVSRFSVTNCFASGENSVSRRFSSKFSFKKFFQSPNEFISPENSEKLVTTVDPGSKLTRAGLAQTLGSKLVFFQPLLEMIISQTGLPSWIVIALLSTGIRLALTPFTVAGHLEELKKDMNKDEYNRLMMMKNNAITKHDKKNFQIQYYRFLQKHKIKESRKMIGSLVSLPVYIPMFLSLRSMIATAPQLLSGSGILWFTNLTVCDPYFILPLVNAFLVYLNLRQNGKLFEHIVFPKWLMYASSAITLVATAKFAAAYFCFWIPMQLVTLATTIGFGYYKKRKEMKIAEFEEEDFENNDVGFKILDSEDW